MSLTPTIQRNGNDTYVTPATPSLNYSGSLSLLTKSAGTGSESRGLIYFSRSFPLGATIQSATLRLYQTSTESVSHTIELHRITAGWSLSTTNWNNQPVHTTTGKIVKTQAAGVANAEWAFDVTTMMQTVADGGLWGGFKIISTTDEYMPFWSTQAALKPQLEVTWYDNPDAPSTLSPAGNRSVSIAKPILRFDYTDVSGSTTLAAVQVQINATNVWTAPTFDSGTVTTTVPQLDLTTTAYAGLAAGSSTWWRVRVQDGAGLWSSWSAGAQFTRTAKGTLTMTNPPSSGLISEPTPPVVWTFTGATAAAYQVFVVPTPNLGVALWNTGKVAGTATSVTMPAGVLVDDTSYTVYLRVWDTVSRESTPGDPAYSEVIRNFTYDYSATVAPVTSLTATDLTPVPGVTLAWSRSTAPDSFIIRRNGIIIASGQTPAALTTGGTSYAYTDSLGDPKKANTWRVDAVVNAVTSTSNPTVVKTLSPRGMWLRDPSRNLAVQLYGRDPGNWGMGEQAATHAPLGGARSIRITQSLRGFEGSVQGTMMANDAGSVATQLAALWAMKSTPGRYYYLTLQDMTLEVVIGNVVAAPVPLPELQKLVTFDFWAKTPPFTPVL